MKLESYDTNKKNLIAAFRQLEQITSDYVLPEYKVILDRYCREIEDYEFKIVVVGEFSRGKSTFINALLGEKLLPSKALPTTATLNKISYANEKKVTIHYHDKNSPLKEISLDDFKTLNAPREPIEGDHQSEDLFKKQSEYLQSISFVNIKYPLALCKNNISIIDTPGTNDLDPARELLTNAIIPQSDVAIMLLSSLKILSESEISLLRDRLLENDIQKIFLVINFKDQVKSDDYERLINFVNDNTRNYLQNPKIHLVSSAEALNGKRKQNGDVLSTRKGKVIEPWLLEDTGFLELEKDLANFLENEPGQNRIDKYKNRLSNLMKDKVIPELNLYEDVTVLEITEIQKKVEEIIQDIRNIKTDLRVFKRNLRLQMLNYIDTSEDWYKNEIKNIEEKVYKSIEPKLIEDEIVRAAEDTLAKSEKLLHIRTQKKLNGDLFELFEKESRGYFISLNKIETNISNFALVPTEVLKSDVKVTTFADTLEESINSMIGKASYSDSLIEKSLYAVGVIAAAGAFIITSLLNIFNDSEQSRINQLRLNVMMNIRQKNDLKKRQFQKQLSGLVEQSEKEFVKNASHNIDKAIEILNKKIAIQQLSKAEKEQFKKEVRVVIKEVKTIMANL